MTHAVVRHALVTGATGGLGRELVRQLLDAGYRVTATGRDARIGAALGTCFLTADLVHDPLEALVEDVDVVFHLAALSSPWGSDAAFRAINVDATLRLLAAARGDAFIYASTPSIYAEARDRLALTETSPIARPFANAYAGTKYQAERAVLAADRPGFRTIAIRPRAIIGPHDTVLLPRLTRTARKGWFPLPGGGRALIEPTDVRDAARAFLAADTHRARAGGQAINIASGDPRRLRDLLDILFARTGQRVRYRSIPTAAFMAAGTAMEAVAKRLPGRPEPLATRYGAMTLAYSQTMRLDKARDLLDWQPRYRVEAMIEHAVPHA